ncbi:MAG TPA: TonB-dependent receptor [Candidatus Sulfotelmatobacter sp.]|nr:TonB-dependent receptor [Candidatus Sulfotelmatobacter sp.]
MNVAKFLAVSIALTMMLGRVPSLLAQGTDLGTIRGSVTDSSGAVIANAKVLIVDLSTSTARETATNSQGEYQVFGLRPGNYKVTISAPNMRTVDLTGIVLSGSDVVAANAVLGVASQAEAVQVTTEAPTINTADQTISDTITSREVLDLPRDSRDVYSFLYLNPNITQSTGDGTFKFLGFQSYGANFTLDGQRSTSTLDGSASASEPSLEAVGELNVLSNDFSAEYAGISSIRVTTKRGSNRFHGSAFYNNKNSALAGLTIQDQQGIRDAQGSLYPYPSPYFNLNDVGGSLGGPIPGLKRTWFFMAYERNYDRDSVQITDNRLPHPAFWTGNFSPLITNPDDMNADILPSVPSNVTLTPQEIATDTYCVGWPNCTGTGDQFVIIPSRLLNPNVQQLIGKYFPKIDPSIAINTSNGRIGELFQTLMPSLTTRDLGTLRIDHDFSEKDHVYGVLNEQAFSGGNAAVRSPFTGLGLTQQERRTHTLSGSYVRTIRNNIINEARGGFNREFIFRRSNTTLQGFLSSIGFNQSAIDAYGAVVGPSELNTYGHTVITYGSKFTSFDRSGDRNTDRQESQYLTTFGDTLTWVIRNHNLKMGADFVHNEGLDGFSTGRGNPRGTMTYTGGSTDAFANFLLGQPPDKVTFIAKTRPDMDVTNWEQGYFFQDDWKVKPKLTLNLGVRYELVSPWVDKHDILLNFDPTFNNNTGRFIVPSQQTLSYLDPRIPATLPTVTAAQSGLGIGRGLVRTDKNNLAPRVGVAWGIGEKSVIRGGYGVYFPTSAAQGIRDPISTNGFNQSLTKETGTVNPPIQAWPTPLTGGDVVLDSSAFSINAVPVGLHAPLVQQFNGTFERQVGMKTAVRLSYLGTHASGLIGGIDLNEIAPSNNPWGTTIGDGVTACSPDNGDCLPTTADYARLAYPTLGDYLLTYGNYGHSQTNIFQTQVERRYSGGLMFNASYTYTDQKSTGIDQGNSSLGGVPYNPFQPQLDYTQDAWVSRNRFVFYGVYDLPVGRNRKLGRGLSKWADTVIGGWQTTFQMFAKSGTAFTPYWTCDNCGNSARMVGPGNIASESIDALGDFNDFIGYRPMIVGNYKQHVGDQIFNPDAFAPPPMGADVFTNSAIARKNLLWGPGGWGVNFGLHKDFRFGERVTASLGADFDNIFNHPIRMPNQDFGDNSFSYLGGFNIKVNPQTLQPMLESGADCGNAVGQLCLDGNSDFARAYSTFPQEGVDSRRTIRLRLRVTF